jgi:hypothetical protein
MKLSVITITCRSNPRFAEMARSMMSSFRKAPADTILEWIIVDDKLWWMDGAERIAEIDDVLATLPDETRGRVHVEHFAPPPSLYRGPDISDPLPAHNTARNAGLAAAALDSTYLVFLSDCTAVTEHWFTTALDIASKNQGWKCQVSVVHDLPIPHDEPFRYQDSHDNLHAVPCTTVAGPCWGVPRDALLAVGGFDTDYDGEDDLYDHEVLLRLGRSGVPFVTTKRARVVRLKRTQTKPDVTTRQEVLRAKRNQLYYTQLGQDRSRTLPGAAASNTGPLGLAQPGGGAARAPRPAPSRSMARPSARSAPVAMAAPNPPRAAPAPRPPPRPAAPVPAAARPANDGGAPPRAAAPVVDTRPRAQHASEICGLPGAATGLALPCILVAGHAGVHTHGTPQWIVAMGNPDMVPAYRAVADALSSFLAAPPATTPEGDAWNQTEQTRLEMVLDDLWYAMSDEHRDEIDPVGAPSRAADRAAAAAPQAPAPMLTLHERAKAAEQVRKDRTAAERAGTAPPPETNERCVYTPTQGTFKLQRCRLRARHGGAHAYGEPGTVGRAAIVQPAPAKAAVSREPPSPTAPVAATIAALDEHTTLIHGHFARLPNTPARNVVMLAVIARREGIVVDEDGYIDMLSEAVPALEPAEGEDPVQLEAVRQDKILAELISVQELCATLPKIPCTPDAFGAVGAFATALDHWRITQGLQPRIEMSLYTRAYAAAADINIQVKAPDDFGDYASDDLADLERTNAARDDDAIASVEPLTPEQAKAEEEAARALAEMEAEAAAAGQEDAPV